MKIVWTSQFKKDYKRIQKRGYPFDELKKIADELAAGKTLDAKHRDHPLKGLGKRTYRECHIRPDWLLIYRIEENAIVFVRTGTHSDLFR